MLYSRSRGKVAWDCLVRHWGGNPEQQGRCLGGLVRIVIRPAVERLPAGQFAHIPGEVGTLRPERRLPKSP